MPADLHPAYLLHRRRYRETSLIVDLLSSAHGRVALVARGVLRQHGAPEASLQPFQRLQVSWHGRGELGTLTRAESDGTPLLTAGRRLFSGFYLNEVVMRISARHDPNAALYAAYESALQRLAGECCEEQVLRHFEKTLLAAVGYGMNLTHEADSGDPVRAERSYRYFVEQGPVAAPANGYHVCVHGSTLLALADGQTMDDAGLREAKVLMRFVLRHYLGDRPLAARALFRRPDTRAPDPQRTPCT